MASKVYLPKVVSPVGVLAFSWIDKPDEKFSDGKDPQYKATLVMDDNEASQAFIADIRAKATEVAPKMKEPVKLKKGFKVGKDMSDKGEEFEGKICVEFKSNYQPTVKSKSGEKLEPSDVKAGDLVRISGLVKPYSAFGSGASLKFRQILLVEKRNGNGEDDFSDYYEEPEESEDETDGDDDGGDKSDF